MGGNDTSPAHNLNVLHLCFNRRCSEHKLEHLYTRPKKGLLDVTVVSLPACHHSHNHEFLTLQASARSLHLSLKSKSPAKMSTISSGAYAAELSATLPCSSLAQSSAGDSSSGVSK